MFFFSNISLRQQSMYVFNAETSKVQYTALYRPEQPVWPTSRKYPPDIAVGLQAVFQVPPAAKFQEFRIKISVPATLTLFLLVSHCNFLKTGVSTLKACLFKR